MTSTVMDLDLYLLALTDPVGFFREATGYDPQPWQGPFLRCETNTLTLKGRQVGASTATGSKAVRLGLLKPRSTSLIVSPGLNQSKEVLELEAATDGYTAALHDRAKGLRKSIAVRLVDVAIDAVAIEVPAR